jgi:hypothetical protein
MVVHWQIESINLQVPAPSDGEANAVWVPGLIAIDSNMQYCT